MMDYEKAKKHHFDNLSRQVGHDVSKRYNYIISNDDLTNAYLQMRDELGYPLMMDSKYRRAIIYNKKGLEKKIEKLVYDCIISNAREFENMVANDIADDIINQLNDMVQTANGQIKKGNVKKNNAMSEFAKSLAKGLVQGVGTIIDDIIKYDERKK